MTYSSSPNSGQPSRKLWKRIVLGFIVLMALGAGIFMAGPRNEFGASVPTQRTPPPETIAALDEWIKTSEAAFPGIKPGNAKGIVWNSAAKERTPWSVVYIHGFSASRLETAPVADLVAKALGANAFHTRLAGHGRPGTAMGDATVQDWMADALEAVRIGHTLGERVLVISCSTGSTLATWLAMTPEGSKIAAHVFVSPNSSTAHGASRSLMASWGTSVSGNLKTRPRPMPGPAITPQRHFSR
jgi:pimeloyl-ACP methyl ester carboxylesterase